MNSNDRQDALDSMLLAWADTNLRNALEAGRAVEANLYKRAMDFIAGTAIGSTDAIAA